MFLDINDVKKMIMLFNELYSKNYSVDDLSESNVKSVYRKLANEYHPDRNQVPNNESKLVIALKYFPNIKYENEFEKSCQKVQDEINKIYELYREQYINKINPVEKEYEERKDTSLKIDEMIKKDIEEIPEILPFMLNYYNKSISYNESISKETIEKIYDKKCSLRELVINIIKQINTLKAFAYEIEDLTNHDPQMQSLYLEEFNKLLKSFYNKVNKCKKTKNYKTIYIDTYEEISKIVATLSFEKEINDNIKKNTLLTLEDFKDLKDTFEKKFLYLETIENNGKKTLKEVKKKISDIILDYKNKLECYTEGLIAYKELEKKITDNGLNFENFEIKKEEFLNISNLEELKNKISKVKINTEIKLLKSKLIRDIKDKIIKLPDIAIPKDTDEIIDKIANYKTIDKSIETIKIELTQISEKLLNRLNYSLFVNEVIDGYLLSIKNDNEYTYTYGDIKTKLDKLRDYYVPYDYDHKKFLIEFEIDKRMFKEMARKDYNNANEKKEKLKKEFTKCYEEGIFLKGTEEQVQEKIDNVRTFGEFSGLENKIILTELRKQMNILVPKLTNTKEKILFEIKALKPKKKKSNDPFILDLVSEEMPIAVKERRERCDYIDQALECFTTICEMFDRSENFNSMIIYPKAEFVTKDKNRESFKQVLKQSVELINLDYENDSLEQISTVVNRIYMELLLDEKQEAKELKALNEATKKNREKHRR